MELRTQDRVHFAKAEVPDDSFNDIKSMVLEAQQNGTELKTNNLVEFPMEISDADREKIIKKIPKRCACLRYQIPTVRLSH